MSFMPEYSLLLSSGDRHLYLRKAIGKAIAQSCDLGCVRDHVSGFCQTLDRSRVADISDAANDFFVKIISKFLIGRQDRKFGDVIAKTCLAIDKISTATMVFPALTNVPPFSHGHSIVAKTIGELRKEIQRVQLEGVARNSFLAKFSAQVKSSDLVGDCVEDNLVMLCFVMLRSLKLMFQNMAHVLGAESEWQNKLRNAVLGGQDDELLVRATVKETLRLAPMIPLVARQAKCDLDVDGFSVRQGDIILITPYLTHFRSSCFPSPGEFDPMRFDKNQNYSHQFIPYGGGKNHCIGSGWAVQVICKLFQTLLPIVEFTAPRNQGCLKGFSMRSLFLKRRCNQFTARLI